TGVEVGDRHPDGDVLGQRQAHRSDPLAAEPLSVPRLPPLPRLAERMEPRSLGERTAGEQRQATAPVLAVEVDLIRKLLAYRFEQARSRVAVPHLLKSDDIDRTIGDEALRQRREARLDALRYEGN